MQNWTRILIALFFIQYSLGCYRITQNNHELQRYVSFDQMSMNVQIHSGHSIVDCFRLGNAIQKIYISWRPLHTQSPQVNVTVESAEKQFFVKKTVPATVSEVAVFVFITPSRRYDITIDIDARLFSKTSFTIENERPCQIIPYLWLGMCIIFIILSGLLLYKKNEKSFILQNNNSPTNNKLIAIV